jgi:heat shock protein HslJ
MHNARNQKFGETVWVGITVPGAATPTPAHMQTPVPNISFTADRTTITSGQPVLFKWAAENVKAVYFYHDGQNWSDHGVPGVGQSTEYPPYTMNYYLRVVQRNDAVVVRTIAINVNAAANAPVIDYLSASPPQVTVGQCISVDWKVSGQVTRVALLINNSPVWDGAPVSGNYPDCPNAAGTRAYKLQATGPGGNATQQTTVNVQNIPQPPPDTPEPVPPVQPPVIQNFTIAPTNIEQGNCVVASWNTGGGTTSVQLLRDGAVIWEAPSLNNSVQDCPPNAAPATINYRLIAYNNAGQEDGRDVQVQVASAPPQNPLADTSWKLQSGEGLSEGPIDTVTAYFGADGSLSGNGGCNSYTTSYTVGDQAITIYPPAATGALCGDPADAIEQTYLGLLPQAANFEIRWAIDHSRDQGQEILRTNLVTLATG